MIRKAMRLTGVVLAGLAVIFIAAIGISPYFRRWALLNFPDVYDYDKLPARVVSRSAHPFRFPECTAGDWVSPLKLAYGHLAIADEAALGRFLAEHGTTAFIAIKDGCLLDERYFNGFRRDSLFKSFSVTKSVISALIGTAVADGWIGSIDDPVTKYIPEMRDPGFRRVTLRHCLDLTGGISYARGNMPWTSQPRMYYTTDVRGYVRGAGIEAEPGVRFSAEDLSPIILGWVLERALRRHPSTPTLSAYLTERIWQPMGAEYDARWIVDREQGGLEKGESGLTARAIDLAKFAELYLQQGRWNSRQVIPAEWVSESTSVDSDPPGPNLWKDGFLKHQWWGRKTTAPALSDFYANGHFGQRLYVSPRHRLVLVRMGDSNRGIDWGDFLGAVADAFPMGPAFVQPAR